LIQYLFRNEIPVDGPFGKDGENESEKDCVEFIQYADKYGLARNACDIVYSTLEAKWRPDGNFLVKANTEDRFISAYRDTSPDMFISPVNYVSSDRSIPTVAIETIFLATPAGHRLRSLATSAALQDSLDDKRRLLSFRKINPHKHDDLEKTLDGFAAEMVLLLRSEINNQEHFRWSKDMRYRLE
jgi:hypothetical protein